MRSNVIYSFKCPEDSCNASYIGYTTNNILIRATQHRQQQSKIFEHFIATHDKRPPKDISNNFKVIYNNTNTKELKIAEAILIKTLKPCINIVYNEIPHTSYLF